MKRAADKAAFFYTAKSFSETVSYNHYSAKRPSINFNSCNDSITLQDE